MTARIELIALCALFLAGGTAAAQQHPALEGLDAYLEEGRQQWQIPGMAVAVVKDDVVIYARGFGLRMLGEPEVVDEHTLFGVASTTKAMTAATLAILVDEGKLAWDDPVVNHIPHFRLYDPYVTSSITVRDLLTHRSGLGRMTGNRLQYMTHRPRSELMYRLRYLEPEQPFRAGYVYSNMMFMVAGELVPAVEGVSWDDFMHERIFRPLGMARSNTSVTQIGDDENAAWPHQEIDGEIRTIPRRNFDNVGPAASVNTSAREMAEWMRLNLGEPGLHNGRRLISEAQMREMQRGQHALPVAPDLASYGLGWRIGNHNGRRTLQHGGATDGMNTNLILVPEENIGVVIMTNTFNNFMTAAGFHIIDLLTDAPPRDWNARVMEDAAALRAQAEERRQAIHDARESGTTPSRALHEYAGFFADSLYDHVEVRHEDGALSLHFWDDPTLVADLEHWHYDTFRAVWKNPAQREKFVWFQMGRDGRPDVLNVEFILRPLFLQVGIYPSDYTREVSFHRAKEPTQPGRDTP